MSDEAGVRSMYKGVGMAENEARSSTGGGGREEKEAVDLNVR